MVKQKCEPTIVPINTVRYRTVWVCKAIEILFTSKPFIVLVFVAKLFVVLANLNHLDPTEDYSRFDAYFYMYAINTGDNSIGGISWFWSFLNFLRLRIDFINEFVILLIGLQLFFAIILKNLQILLIPVGMLIQFPDFVLACLLFFGIRKFFLAKVLITYFFHPLASLVCILIDGLCGRHRKPVGCRGKLAGLCIILLSACIVWIQSDVFHFYYRFILEQDASHGAATAVVVVLVGFLIRSKMMLRLGVLSLLIGFIPILGARFFTAAFILITLLSSTQKVRSRFFIVVLGMIVDIKMLVDLNFAIASIAA